MTPDIFDIVALVIIFLCYCAGRYWLGPSDAKKAFIKHDGRRALYRGGVLALVLAFIVWRTTYGFWPAVLTWVSGCLAGSIGVRLGWNGAKGIDWRYLGSTSADDWWCIWKVYARRRLYWAEPIVRYGHSFIYQRPEAWVTVRIPDRTELGSIRLEPKNYRKAVHRAGLIRTIVEGAVSVGGYALILFA